LLVEKKEHLRFLQDRISHTCANSNHINPVDWIPSANMITAAVRFSPTPEMRVNTSIIVFSGI
jgi:hypothetical protein